MLAKNWSGLCSWAGTDPGTQNPTRKAGAVAERKHKVVVIEAGRKGKGVQNLSGEGHEMGMLAPTLVSDCQAGDALMESTPFESKPKT